MSQLLKFALTHSATVYVTDRQNIMKEMTMTDYDNHHYLHYSCYNKSHNNNNEVYHIIMHHSFRFSSLLFVVVPVYSVANIFTYFVL